MACSSKAILRNGNALAPHSFRQPARGMQQLNLLMLRQSSLLYQLRTATKRASRIRNRPSPPALPVITEQGDDEMGIFTKDIKSMDDMLLHGLQDIYYAEHQILKALPKMIDKATNRDLVTGLKNHLEETNKQVERLQSVFAKLGKQPSTTQCPAIDGIIKEADETAGEIEDKAVLDAAIVANAQAVEHYEICRYGTLIAWAEELGHDEIVRFLTTNLNEEKAANTKLNTVALRKGVNAKASTAA
jgi:ferritin-like metal-binding protein YciE